MSDREIPVTQEEDEAFNAKAPEVDQVRESAGTPQPISMVLHCPECRTRHVDVGEFATKVHHTHSCQGCGLTWRPAVVPTVGVQFLPGFKDAAAASDPTGSAARYVVGVDPGGVDRTATALLCGRCGRVSPSATCRHCDAAAISAVSREFACPDCGAGVVVDEDGCCAQCGRDTTVKRVATGSAARDLKVSPGDVPSQERIDARVEISRLILDARALWDPDVQKKAQDCPDTQVIVALADRLAAFTGSAARDPDFGRCQECGEFSRPCMCSRLAQHAEWRMGINARAAASKATGSAGAPGVERCNEGCRDAGRHVLEPVEPLAPIVDKSPECPGPDCLMCSNEACNKCGAGCWNNDVGRPKCEHDVIERHDEPLAQVAPHGEDPHDIFCECAPCVEKNTRNETARRNREAVAPTKAWPGGTPTGSFTAVPAGEPIDQSHPAVQAALKVALGEVAEHAARMEEAKPLCRDPDPEMGEECHEVAGHAGEHVSKDRRTSWTDAVEAKPDPKNKCPFCGADAGPVSNACPKCYVPRALECDIDEAKSDETPPEASAEPAKGSSVEPIRIGFRLRERIMALNGGSGCDGENVCRKVADDVETAVAQTRQIGDRHWKSLVSLGQRFLVVQNERDALRAQLAEANRQRDEWQRAANAAVKTDDAEVNGLRRQLATESERTRLMLNDAEKRRDSAIEGCNEDADARVAEAIAGEREACAKVCDVRILHWKNGGPTVDGRRDEDRRLAALIRARSGEPATAVKP